MKKKFTAVMVLFVMVFSATLPYFAAENTEDNYSNVIYDEDGNKMESIKYHGHVSSHWKAFEIIIDLFLFTKKHPNTYPTSK